MSSKTYNIIHVHGICMARLYYFYLPRLNRKFLRIIVESSQNDLPFGVVILVIMQSLPHCFGYLGCLLYSLLIRHCFVSIRRLLIREADIPNVEEMYVHTFR